MRPLDILCGAWILVGTALATHPGGFIDLSGSYWDAVTAALGS
jgi:hypothetical protein